MIIIRLIKKIVLLIKLFFTNHRYYKYLMKHYQNKTISEDNAKKICCKNDNEYNKLKITRFTLETYDKSNQYTHPDIITYNGKTFLMMTPYPYGMEAYENPCLYELDDSLNVTQYASNPIAKQQIVKKRNHLSDPFFCLIDDRLLLLYRKNVFDQNGEVVSIEYQTMDKSFNISSSAELIDAKEDMLSPLMYKKGNTLFLQYINRIDDITEIIEKQFSLDFKQISESKITTEGFPSSYYLWHFGINHNIEDGISGLLLLRDIEKETDFILCEAIFDEEKRSWVFKKQIIVPESLNSIIDHVYKSCYIPNTNKILLSYRDKKYRYYSSIIDII